MVGGSHLSKVSIPMIVLTELRRQLETSEPVRMKFAEQGEFTITAGQFASTVASVFGVEKDAKALAAGMGEDTALFRVRPRNGDAKTPIIVSTSAWAGASGIEVMAADLVKVPATIEKSRLGPGGYVVVTVGKATVQMPLMISDDLRNALIAARNDGLEIEDFVETEGEPALSIKSPLDGEIISTVKAVPQRDIPPHSDDVPHLVDLEVVEILEPSRQYKSPRLTVRLGDGSGQTIVGLIATQPIVRSVMGVYEGPVEINEAAVGQKFQILETEERVRRDGEKVKNEDGTIQKQVIVRNTTKKLEFAL